MTRHVFGNSPSPAVAIYGLQKTAEAAGSTYGEDVTKFVQRHFYVDDGLISLSSTEEAINLLTRTQKGLADYGNLRLHKFVSNSQEVMSALPGDDISQDLKDMDFDAEHLPLQRSLGLYWDLQADIFTYRIAEEDKPFTCRGVLSTVNSIYDPLGFAAPLTVLGKLLLRKFLSGTIDWDEPLPENWMREWKVWKDCIKTLQCLKIPRMYVPVSLSTEVKKELHVFSDASKESIAAVSYLKTVHEDGSSEIGFVMGKAKIAPLHGHTIPRLELCAAVLAVELSEVVLENLDEEIDIVKFYTDSKVVLGYIHNQTRRFYVYVENRVNRIHRSTKPEQWNYVPTSVNPADRATRSMVNDFSCDDIWLKGPETFLSRRHDLAQETPQLVQPEDDKEVRPDALVKAAKTCVIDNLSIGCHRFERFSEWYRLVNTVALLQRCACAKSFKGRADRSVESFRKAEIFVIKAVQKETYKEEIRLLEAKMHLPKSSSIMALNPYLDEDGVLRVGGRLQQSSLGSYQKHPIILPGKSHISTLIVRHYHQSVRHQGRHLTEGAVRSGGYWITGVKRLISSILHSCVQCRKLRGKEEVQLMSDLPADRLEHTPPFTNVGVDAFGPWTITTRRTRGGSANSKRWAILFTCLTTRAIHIELVEEMSSSAFINALKRFEALRGKVKLYRSDRGTNFVGATDSLKIDAVNVEEKKIVDHLYQTGTKWIFNAPHSSHMGGVWERLIRICRKILESMLAETPYKTLTHEVLSTFMAEVCAIVNNRPIVNVSTDPENPFILSPATILTQKVGIDHVEDSVGEIDTKDLLKTEWKRVSALSEIFWNRWKKEYLHTLQERRKWCCAKPSLTEGDVVLLKDRSVCRTQWPYGIVVRAIQSEDGKVRKVELKVMRDGKPVVYTRPISELILLVSGAK